MVIGGEGAKASTATKMKLGLLTVRLPKSTRAATRASIGSSSSSSKSLIINYQPYLLGGIDSILC